MNIIIFVIGGLLGFLIIGMFMCLFTNSGKISEQEEKSEKIFSPDFCLSCKKEMRKWITHEYDKKWNPILKSGICHSMCITDGCIEQGIVNRAIQNINNFKLEIRMEI